MPKPLHALAAIGVFSALLAGCNSGGGVPSPVTPVTTSSGSTTTQTLTVSANSPSTVTAPTAGGYTPSLSLPGLSAAISAPVTVSNAVPTGVSTFSLSGPVAQSVSTQAKPSNATTVLYVAAKPNVATTVSAGATFGVTLTLPSAPASTAYYLAFFDGTTWYSNYATAGTISGAKVTWSSVPIAANITFNPSTTYALAVYSVPVTATPSPAPTTASTAVTGQAVPTPAPVPKSVSVAKSLPAPTSTSTAAPLSTTDKKTQGAVSATMSAMKSKTSASKGAKKTSKSSQFFRRAAQGAFRHKLDDSSPSCTDGLVETITTNSDGSTQVEDVTYADDACATTVLSDATFNYQAADSNGTVTAIGGTNNFQSDGSTLQGYDVTSLTVYNALATDGSYDGVSSVTHYPDASGTSAALGVDYLATVIDSSGNETDGTLSFTYDFADGYEIGSLYTDTAPAGSTDSSGNVTTTVTGASQLYNDSTYQLSVGTFPLAAGSTTWTVSGGSVVSDTTSTQTSTADVNGTLTSDTQTTTDNQNQISIQFQSVPNDGGYTGTITSTADGSTLGTMTTNEEGTGTVTYADGTTGTLTEFAVGS